VTAAQMRPGPLQLWEANAERSTVAIDSSQSFLIVWIRSAEMNNTVANIVHNTLANSRYYSTR
jgi:hypothetical protein